MLNGGVNPSARSKSPLLFVGAILLKVIMLAWMGYHAFPKITSDAILFKQPAYMRLYNGSFSIPTTSGDWPHATEVFGGFPPFYTYANLLAFKLFGFSAYGSLALDLTVHLILSLIIALVLLKMTGSQTVASLFLLLCTFLILPIGRPEELGALLVVLAFLVSGKSWRRYAMASLLLGVSLATALIPGILGLILFLTYDALNSGWTARWILRSLGIVAASTAVMGIVWVSVVMPHFVEAFEQFRYHVSRRTWRPGLVGLAVNYPLWTAFFISVMLAVFGLWFFLFFGSQRLSRDKLLTSVAISLPFCIGLELAFHRAFYDYRLIGYVCLAAAFYASYLLFARNGVGAFRRTKPVGAFALSWVLLASLLPNKEIIRYILVPFGWNENSARYSDAVRAINSLVPVNASVGGDAALWTAITDGRPYYAVNLVMNGQGELPQFLVSTTFWGGNGQPYVMLLNGWRSRLADSYEEITDPASSTEEGCEIKIPILGTRVPISHSNCDWSVRIWKRREAVEVSQSGSLLRFSEGVQLNVLPACLTQVSQTDSGCVISRKK